jgi:hypothetical protein
MEENYHIDQGEIPINVGPEEPSQWERKPSASASASSQHNSTVAPTSMENNDIGWSRKSPPENLGNRESPSKPKFDILAMMKA